MKIAQAKQIVGTMNLWQMFLMGIGNQPTEVLDGMLTLSQLMEANTKVVKWNKKQRDRQSLKGGSCEQHLTMADRLIAATYVAMNYEPDDQVKAIMGNVGVGCVKMDYSK